MKTRVPLKVKLAPDAVEALRKLPALHPDYFFWDGRRSLNRATGQLRHYIKRIGAIAKVTRAVPHRFRDTFACALLGNGADIRTVQLLLGHVSVNTTEKHYAHFVASHQALLDGATATLDFGGGGSGPIGMYSLKDRLGNA